MQKINRCGTVHHNRQGMPADFGLKTLKLKEGDIIRKVKGGTSTVCWKDKRDHLLNNRLNPQHQVTLWTKQEMHQNICAVRVTIRVIGFCGFQ